MSFFAIFLALVLEQARPLGIDNPVYRAVEGWTGWMTRTLDAGVQHLAWVTWGMTTLTPALLALLVHALADWGLGWLAAVLWNVALLYVTLGFRQFSHHFTDIRDALDLGDEQRARELLAQWQLPAPYPLVFVLAFAPMLVFMFTGDAFAATPPCLIAQCALGEFLQGERPC